ncbi:MAG: DUF4276 family protein [Oscillospiraceae bacterium]|jgi:hypothetical protein|nr:DUF4276 family protein [Oscillospiraceae bacterium]
MNEIYAIVEGPTEQNFIEKVLAPYLGERNVALYAAILRKPGENGGDVKFSRARNDIGKFLKQRADTQVTLMLDYYGIRKDWPGYGESKQQTTHTIKHSVLMRETQREVQRIFPGENSQLRFIPYFSMHEIEALYFCDPAELARNIGVGQAEIDAVIRECGEPEKINDRRDTAPSKRLEALSTRFRKTSTGLTIATRIGIPAMRAACPLFNQWITRLEA